MKINIEKSQIWTPLWSPFAPHFFKNPKRNTFCLRKFFHLGLSFLYIYKYKYIYILKRMELPQFLC